MSLVTKSQAVEFVQAWQAGGEIVVFTNGCFDLLHRGHVDLLNTARSFGDRLVVGLNSDESVTRLKGVGRPVQPQEDRGIILSALSAVDLVVIFPEETPRELIRVLRPDVLVKGGDYKPENIVGAREVRSWGGKVAIVPYREGASTSELIRKIQSLAVREKP